MPKGIYKKPDSPYWWANYTDGAGKRIRRSTGVPVAGGAAGEKEAVALLGKWRAEAHQAKMWGREPKQSAPVHIFDDVMMAYFEDRVSTQRAGLARAKSTARPLYLAFHGLSMAGLSGQDVKAYTRQRQAEGAAPGTINKEVGMLSAACNYAREDLGWEVGNPAAGKKIAEPEGRVRWLEHEEAVRLIQAAATLKRAPWLADFVQLALNTGCRAGELLGLEWARVDLRNNLLILDQTKNGKRRSVPLNDSAREAVLSRASYRAGCQRPDTQWVFCKADGSRLTTVKRSFAAALKLAGIEDFRIHDQRHTLASWLVIDGVPLAEVRDALGHSSVKTTERYAHLHPENVRAAVGRVQGVSRSCHAENSEPEEKWRKLLK